MKLASWNVNSVRARLDRVVDWLRAQSPDVVCLQETKVEDADFPAGPFEALGYRAATFGQRTYNGVAILSREPAADLARGLGGGPGGEEARFLAATVGGVRVASVYVPNGQAVGSDKFAHKLAWLRRLRAWLDAQATPAAPLALCGDFNVAPDERDVHDPALWAGEALFHPDARAALAEVTAWGLEDALRLHHPEAGLYSWWDYRQLSFPKNRGLRIDHIFCTEPLAARCRSAIIDREARKGKLPSDHAPVVAVFEG